VTLNEMRIMERQLEEHGLDVDTIIFFVEVAQSEGK